MIVCIYVCVYVEKKGALLTGLQSIAKSIKPDYRAESYYYFFF